MTNKEAYNKGYKDGQEALAYHLELCKEEGNIIEIPEGATNGDMVKALFPNLKATIDDYSVEVDFGVRNRISRFALRWWNSPYRKEQE